MLQDAGVPGHTSRGWRAARAAEGAPGQVRATVPGFQSECISLLVHPGRYPCALACQGKDQPQRVQQLQAVADLHKHGLGVLLLVLQNGTLKSKVHGANVPELLERVAEWVTPLPGLDDLEV